VVATLIVDKLFYRFVELIVGYIVPFPIFPLTNFLLFTAVSLYSDHFMKWTVASQ